MTFQFFQLTLRGFIIVYSFCDSCRAADQRAEDSQQRRIGKIPPRFTTSSIRFFIGFFFFVFKPIPIFVLAFIAAQTAVAAALSPRVESFAVIRFRASSASILSATCRFVKSLLRE